MKGTNVSLSTEQEMSEDPVVRMGDCFPLGVALTPADNDGPVGSAACPFGLRHLTAVELTDGHHVDLERVEYCQQRQMAVIDNRPFVASKYPKVTYVDSGQGKKDVEYDHGSDEPD